MMDVQYMLTEAARSGDIKLLHESIRRNLDVLRRIDEAPFLDTPLHVAASEGQVPFALEMMRLMPSYARKSNADGFSPVHAAVVRGQTKAATQLTKRAADLIRHSGLEGFTPLHCAAQTGNVDLLGAFLASSPESMEDVTVRGETALTVALKNEKLEAFEFLVGWIFLGYDHSRRWKKNIVCFEDDDGQTVGQRYRSRLSYKPQVLGLLENVAEEDERHLQILVQGSGFSSAVFGITDPFVRYLRPDQKLMLAAYEGDINGLHSSLADDPDLLDRIDNVIFVDTPLHIAASTGKTHFALEMMRLKPSFARKMNPKGYSPLHLAVQNSKFDTVLRLVDVDNDLVRVKGKGGKTAFHCTVEKGTGDHIARLLVACPLSIIDLTDRKETAVHLAVKIDRVDALEVLLGWLVRAANKNILTWTDDEGNNLWSIAEERNNDMVKKLLWESRLIWLRWAPRPFARNSGQLDREKDLLGNSEARATSFYGETSLADYLRSRVSIAEEFSLSFQGLRLRLPPASREGILVVLALVATATYQAVLSPPGGVWQGDPTLPFQVSSEGGNAIDSTSGQSSRALGLVGKSVMQLFQRFAFFMANSAAFFLSTSYICALIPHGQWISSLIMVPLIICYMMSLYVIGHRSLREIFIACYAVIAMIPTVSQLWFTKSIWRARELCRL